MALTFDDGPGPYTLQLLDLLDKYNVKATFFVNGGVPARGRMDDATTPWPAILQRMYLSGHQIANHSWSHRKLDKVDNSTRRNEMIYNEMAFRNVFGFIPTYMRAPYFRCAAESGCLDYMNQLGYHVVDRTIETRESFGAPKTRFLQGLKSKNGAYIVSAHDSRLDTVSVLAEFMIITAKARGYELMTVGECLGDPKENWYREAPSRGILKSAAQLKPHPRALEEE